MVSPKQFLFCYLKALSFLEADRILWETKGWEGCYAAIMETQLLSLQVGSPTTSRLGEEFDEQWMQALRALHDLFISLLLGSRTLGQDPNVPLKNPC